MGPSTRKYLFCAAGLALSFAGCNKNASSPVAPSRALSLAVSVPIPSGSRASLLGASSNEVLYNLSPASPGGAPITGLAGPFSTSGVTGSIDFTIQLAAGGASGRVLALQLNDASNHSPLAIGASALNLSGSDTEVTVELGSVIRNCYFVSNLPAAGASYSFDTNGQNPVTALGYDVSFQQGATGFEFQDISLQNNIAYMGKGDLVNFAFVPDASSFFLNSVGAKSGAGIAATDLAAGDIFCVKLSAGGHVWMQVVNGGVFGTTAPTFRFRLNHTLPYYAYDPTICDFDGRTPTSTFTPTITFTSTDTLTPTITFTPTDSPTPTLTPTITDTFTITNTPLFTSTFTPSFTPTDSPTFTSTLTPTDTQTPQPKLVLAWNGEPSSQTYLFNQSNVTGIQVVLKALGQEPVSVSQIGFGLAGSIGSGQVVGGSVQLIPDSPADDPGADGIYVVSANPTPVASGSFSAGVVNFGGLTNLTLAPNAPQTFLLVFSLNAAGAGNFLNTVNASSILAFGTTTGLPALVLGGPFNGNIHNVLGATATPTNTSSFTLTATATNSPTATATNTLTSTPTRTPTPSNTPSFTVTNSPSFTSTFTSTNSPTATFTPTFTFSFTPTNTATHTATNTPTVTPTMTDTLTPVPTVNIPDAHLLAAVQSVLIASGAITFITDPITAADMATITSLTANSVGISSLVGLEYCVALTQLTLSGNNISDLTPISGLTGLTFLNLNYNQVSDISLVAGLTQLNSLNLYGNQISALPDMSSLTLLTDLDLGYNLITDITKLSSLAALTYLDLDFNPVTDMSPLVNLYNLQYLYMAYDNISAVPSLAGMPSLSQLDLDNNYLLSDISGLAGAVSLGYLNLDYDDVSDLSSLSNLFYLYDMELDGNQITDLAPLVTVAGEGDTNAYLSVLNNPLTNANVTSEVLTLAGAPYDWTVNYSVIIPDANLSNAVQSILVANGIVTVGATIITPANMAALTSLTAVSAGISSLEGLEFCTGMTDLDLQWNNVSDLSPLSNLTGLTSLNVESNQITDISILSGLTGLTALDLNNNRITDVTPLQYLTQLNYLGLDVNQITDFSVLVNPGLPNLIVLELSGNMINSIPDLTVLGALKQLYLEYNQLTDLQPLVDVDSMLGINGATIYVTGNPWTDLTNLNLEISQLQSDGCVVNN